MWHNIRLMNFLANSLIGLGALLVVLALAVFLIRMPFNPIRQIKVLTPVQRVDATEMAEMLQPVLKGNFFSIPLQPVQKALEEIPWVRRADVRRRWPGTLLVRIEEHVPQSRWHEVPENPVDVDAADTESTSSEEAQDSEPELPTLVNSFGEVFAADIATAEAERLPLLAGPPNTSTEVLKLYIEIRQALAPLKLQPRQLMLSARLALEVTLDNGTLMNFGRNRSFSTYSSRLNRFVSAYPRTRLEHPGRPVRVDLRYPDGFALAY